MENEANRDVPKFKDVFKKFNGVKKVFSWFDMKALVKIGLILSLFLMTSCDNKITIGEERWFCQNCEQPSDPFKIDTNNYQKVKVLDIKGKYVQFDINGKSESMKCREFNHNTYDENYDKIGRINNLKTAVVFFSLVIIIIGLEWLKYKIF